MENNQYVLAGNTRLRVTHGRSFSIESICQHQKKDDKYHAISYGYDDADETFYESKVVVNESNPMYELVSIHMESGADIRCHPDYEFLMADFKTWIKARDLNGLDQLAAMLHVTDYTVLPYKDNYRKHTLTVAYAMSPKPLCDKTSMFTITNEGYSNVLLYAGDQVSIIGRSSS